MNAALIIELAFLEDLITEQKGFHLRSINGQIPGTTRKKTIIELAYFIKDELKIHRITGHLFFKTNDDHNNVIDVSDFQTKASEPDGDWFDVKKKTVTTVSATLFLICNLRHNKVQQYIHLKYIRNSQAAHGSGYDIKITPKELVDFYKDVIVPVVDHFSNK